MYFVSDLVALDDILRSQKVPSSNLPSTPAVSSVLSKIQSSPDYQEFIESSIGGKMALIEGLSREDHSTSATFIPWSKFRIQHSWILSWFCLV
jgi:hypothetical protein